MKQKRIIYGSGGYDLSKPNNNIIREEEIEVELSPITKYQFFMELSNRNLYKTLINNTNKLTEKELIELNQAPRLSLKSNLITKIHKEILKISKEDIESIFYNAKKII